MTKLVLVVVDALKPAMLERAVEEGKAPMFEEILRRGSYVPDCVSVFPSVTPAASATIATGAPVDRHGVPSIDWYHRGERRYVDYGSSGQAVRTFGVLRTITDTVYNMNFDHLSRVQPTFFERLEDAGIRTACTPFLIFRGRTRHELTLQGWMRRVARAANFRHAVYGPSELFYGELYASREVDCTGAIARPGTRDPYSGCVAAFCERNDLYDFMLFSLPDNDHYSHHHGPAETLTSIARADRHLTDLVEAAGGADSFFADHALILMADHSQTAVDDRIRLDMALGDWRVLLPNDVEPADAELAVCPGARSAMVYVLREEEREETTRKVIARLRELDGVEVLAWLDGEEACVWTGRGELRFGPGATAHDVFEAGWDVDGALETLELEHVDGVIGSRVYPDGLGRLWSALHCAGAGDVLVSAARGYEFVDWGGADHVGGGSHGSLRRGDSLGPLAFVNCGPNLGGDGARARPWSIADVYEIVLEHFGVTT
jgi:type I phosphodiesterase/nucleotide pyrophosphatase